MSTKLGSNTAASIDVSVSKMPSNYLKGLQAEME